MKKFASIILLASSVFLSNNLLALAPSTTPEFTLTLSGSSSQDPALLKIISGLCQANTIDYYNESGMAKPTNFNAYSCSILLNKLALPSTITAMGNLAARDSNQNGSVEVMIYKRSGGGSGEATNGVCGNVATTAQLSVSSSVCTNTGVVNQGGRWWRCSGGNVQRQSDGGLIDLESERFATPYNSVCDTKTVVKNPIWGTIFNTPISLNFRNALQCVQGLVVGDESIYNMPSLPKVAIASAYNGGLKTWDALQALKPDGVTYAPLSVVLADKVAAGQCPGYNVNAYPIPATAAQKRAVACRRVQSSGANTQFRVKFLNASCVSSAQDMLSDNTVASGSTGATVAQYQTLGANLASAALIENSGSSDMAACLNAFADTSTPSGQRWAIGIQSLQHNVDRADNYRFIKIDNSAPTVESVLNLKYIDWVESQWIWLNASGGTPDQRDAVDLQEVLRAGTGGAAAVGSLITSIFNHSFGVSGMVALNTIPGNTSSLPINFANPVATSTHAANGSLQSCRTPQMKFNSGF